MKISKMRGLDLFYKLATFLTASISTYFILRNSPEEIGSQSFIIFGLVLSMFLLIILFNSIYNRYKFMLNNIEENTRKINEIQKYLNFQKSFDKMDKRVSVMEKILDNLSMNKRGEIDFRLAAGIIMLLLLYLFLRSMGYF